ncbi:MAG TPA: DUF2007 domain-containing protein [bacterium]|nr:DUF2007 domain-containing protein [bacterium]
MKKVHTATTEVEAVMLQGMLEDAGIPVLLRSNLIPGYNRPVGGAWDGDLFVPDDRAAEAADLVAGYLKSVKEESPQ